MTKVIDYYNIIVGSFIAVLTAIFGTYWYLFAFYLMFNILDWLSGWYKARKLQKESSAVGLKGIIKKLGYWGIIAVAFMVPSVFIHLGTDILNIDLNFLQMIGWFTLAMLMINEARSILENAVECGYNVPWFLIKGLAITQKLLEAGVPVEREGENE